MEKTKYRKLISEEIIEESEYPEITAPAVKYRGDRGNRDLTFDWSCVSQPFVVNNVPCSKERDQFILFASANLDNLEDFQAEVELTMGNSKKIIAGPKLVYIPTGMTYGPINFKRINKPIVWMNFYIDKKFSKKRVESDEYDKYLVTPDFRSGVFETKTFTNGRPFREQKINTHMMLVLGKDMGPEGANFCVFYYAIRSPHMLTEPTHSHTMDMWIINLGGNPMNVEEFDAEIEMWWGEERQKLVIDSTSVAHVTPNLLHRSIFYSAVNRPFVQIHTYTSAFCDKDNVVSEEGGMDIAEGMNN